MKTASSPFSARSRRAFSRRRREVLRRERLDAGGQVLEVLVRPAAGAAREAGPRPRAASERLPVLMNERRVSDMLVSSRSGKIPHLRPREKIYFFCENADNSRIYPCVNDRQGERWSGGRSSSLSRSFFRAPHAGGTRAVRRYQKIQARRPRVIAPRRRRLSIARSTTVSPSPPACPRRAPPYLAWQEESYWKDFAGPLGKSLVGLRLSCPRAHAGLGRKQPRGCPGEDDDPLLSLRRAGFRHGLRPLPRGDDDRPDRP